MMIPSFDIDGLSDLVNEAMKFCNSGKEEHLIIFFL